MHNHPSKLFLHLSTSLTFLLLPHLSLAGTRSGNPVLQPEDIGCVWARTISVTWSDAKRICEERGDIAAPGTGTSSGADFVECVKGSPNERVPVSGNVMSAEMCASRCAGEDMINGGETSASAPQSAAYSWFGSDVLNSGMNNESCVCARPGFLWSSVKTLAGIEQPNRSCDGLSTTQIPVNDLSAGGHFTQNVRGWCTCSLPGAADTGPQWSLPVVESRLENAAVYAVYAGLKFENSNFGKSIFSSSINGGWLALSDSAVEGTWVWHGPGGIKMDHEVRSEAPEYDHWSTQSTL